MAEKLFAITTGGLEGARLQLDAAEGSPSPWGLLLTPLLTRQASDGTEHKATSMPLVHYRTVQVLNQGWVSRCQPARTPSKRRTVNLNDFQNNQSFKVWAPSYSRAWRKSN